MTIFNLDRNGYYYTISVNGNPLKTEMYESEVKAVEWAEAYLSSFVSYHLNINFDQQLTVEDML